MKDQFNREINYLRISLTDKCNLRCKYCMPEKGINYVDHEDVMTIEEYLRITKIFYDLGIRKVRLTGGEPLVKRGNIELIKGLKEIGIEQIAMTTNGILLKDNAQALKDAGLNRVNISLDTLDPVKFKENTRGGDLQKVLEGIEEAKRVGLVPIKINVVVMRDFNYDEVKDFIEMTKNEDISVRFIELMPLGEALKFKDQYVSNEEIINNFDLIPIPPKDISSPAKYYKVKDGIGEIGFINPVSCTFCANCNRIRLDCKGSILLCLHSTTRIDLLEPLRKGEDVEKILRDIIFNKPESHHLDEGDYNPDQMNTIGG